MCLCHFFLFNFITDVTSHDIIKDTTYIKELVQKRKFGKPKKQKLDKEEVLKKLSDLLRIADDCGGRSIEQIG